MDYVLSGSAQLPELKRQLEALSQRLQEQNADNETELAEYTEVYDRYLQLDGYGWEVKAEKV